MYDLPPHLQTLNAIPSTNSPPSSALTAEQEAEFWAYMNTDELFSNFGLAPQAFESKKAESSRKAAASPAESTDENKPTTLESFLATFADQAAAAPAPIPNYLLSLAPIASASSSPSSSTPVKTSDVLPVSTPAESIADDDTPRVSGAKRLKMMGAGEAEIEEDKRRRNTEASARFRQRKKAREQDLENKAKGLEAQVATLIAEKASLEKENNLLKFVIVNGQGNGGSSSEGLQAALAALSKRKREE